MTLRPDDALQLQQQFLNHPASSRGSTAMSSWVGDAPPQQASQHLPLSSAVSFGRMDDAIQPPQVEPMEAERVARASTGASERAAGRSSCVHPTMTSELEARGEAHDGGDRLDGPDVEPAPGVPPSRLSRRISRDINRVAGELLPRSRCVSQKDINRVAGQLLEQLAMETGTASASNAEAACCAVGREMALG